MFNCGKNNQLNINNINYHFY
ncbi:hypothetical protein XBFM1_850022 [Xenorhabdus bovienii str. feltiae Moldova]|uniref:Uncharacterized protein n=1 Tax=Xenorhabdus bovienii str. feltiae Moldova TaxID=1398200 RepID=A0A077NYG0_XENBV|nr:hypothetical protein XBFM1_850022 [Xenorhabdus bovienii str. feltiae Moldova]